MKTAFAIQNEVPPPSAVLYPWAATDPSISSTNKQELGYKELVTIETGLDLMRPSKQLLN